MQQPLLSQEQHSQITAKHTKAAIFVIFSLGIMVAFSRQSSNLMEEISVGMKEVKAPENAPLIDTEALWVAQMGVPITMLTYTWREIPVEDPEAETEEVQEAQRYIPDFPPKPQVQLSAESIPAHRAYMSSGTIRERKAVILGFPGSGSLNFFRTTKYMQDWMRNAQSKDMKDWKKVNGLMWRGSTGFLQRYNEHMEEEKFRKKMDAFLAEKKQEGFNYIYVFGHSLGGAQAQIAAADLVSDPDYSDWKVVMVTFAAPRVFSQRCATQVNDFFKKGNPFGHEAWRFVNFGDQVPSLPPTGAGPLSWEHIGRPFYIDKPTGGKWILQEQDQDFSPYHATFAQGLVTKNGGSLGWLTTHFMESYRDRLEEIRQTAKSEGVFNRKLMKQSGMTERAKGFVPSVLGGGKKKEQVEF